MTSRHRYSKDDRINAVVHALLEQNWTAAYGHRHARVRSPDGRITLTVPGSPSDNRAALNWIAQIRRTGVPLPGKRA